MRKITIIISFLATIHLCNVNAQEKTIAGDTAHWTYKGAVELSKEIELLNFKTLKYGFAFRFIDMNRTVEIWRENDSIKGLLTNYIQWSRRDWKGKKIGKKLFEKETISPQNADLVYQIIHNSGILDLPFHKDKDPEKRNWHRTDSNPWIFETANEQNYNFKISWAINEEETTQFVEKLKDTLQLRANFNDFRNSLPRTGTYSLGIGITRFPEPISYGLGYYGSYKLPFGYMANLWLNYIGMTRVGVKIGVIQRFDTNGNCDFSTDISKSNLLFKHRKIITGDALSYNYRVRNLHFIDENTVFQNHKITYRIGLEKNIMISLGGDYSLGNDNNLGTIVVAGKYFQQPKIGINGEVSIFNNRLDYSAIVYRTFFLNRKFYFDLGIQYEKFMNYSDVGFFLGTTF
jgi:hypothetical protein